MATDRGPSIRDGRNRGGDPMKCMRAMLAASAALAALLVSGSAMAFPSYSAAHLNIRTGPGGQYPVIATTGFNNEVDVNGCLKDVSWCDVVWNGIRGWAAGQYLDYDASDGIALLPQAGSKVQIPVVTYTAVDAVMPGGVIVGVVPTAVAPVAVIVPATVHAYVATEIVPPVYLTGEVVLGAVLPATVPLYAVPQSAYRFASVNGQRVLVEDTSRRIVYVYP
ncbi:MAG: DUF1236 domain-containing protein [Bauldia sp.]|nr:MAG: DUF1236 domain-containing protein [Bauldia sp.]